VRVEVCVCVCVWSKRDLWSVRMSLMRDSGSIVGVCVSGVVVSGVRGVALVVCECGSGRLLVKIWSTRDAGCCMRESLP
jgi:hypothetical protein